MNYIVVSIASFLGGFIQTITGFGSGLVIMMFLPYILSIVEASALNTLITIALNSILICKFRKHINYKLVIIPAFISFVLSTYAIKISAGLNLNVMKMIFSIFLMCLAIYFIFFSDKVKVKNNLGTMLLCSSLAGIANGLFGVGGPPIALYYLTVTKSKEEYIATGQVYFLLTNIFNTVVRILSGIITKELAMLYIPGFIMILVGEYIGIKLIDKISHRRMKQLMYYFLALSSLITFIQCL